MNQEQHTNHNCRQRKSEKLRELILSRLSQYIRVLKRLNIHNSDVFSLFTFVANEENLNTGQFIDSRKIIISLYSNSYNLSEFAHFLAKLKSETKFLNKILNQFTIKLSSQFSKQIFLPSLILKFLASFNDAGRRNCEVRREVWQGLQIKNCKNIIGKIYQSRRTSTKRLAKSVIIIITNISVKD